MGVKTQLFEVGAYRSDFCLWGWMKNEVLTRNSPYYHLLKYLLFLMKHPVYC